MLVACERSDFLRRVRRAVAEQAVQQEDVEKPDHGSSDAYGFERIEIHATHLDVLDAPLPQRVQRSLPRADDALGPDRAVELVFDLQQAGRELHILAARTYDAQRFVGRI